MHRPRHLLPLRMLTALALLSAPMAMTGAGITGTAWAQSPVFAGPLVEMVPSSGIIGDGKTPADLHFVVLDPAGTPVSGLAATWSAGAGGKGALTQVKPGLYAATWTPGVTNTARSVKVSVEGTVGDAAFERSYDVQLVPGKASRIKMTANPAQITLGQDASATLSISAADPTLKAEDLMVTTTAGTVQNVVSMGGGNFIAQFTPPQERFPRIAQITIADRRNPAKSWGAGALPLVGKTAFPVTGQPGSAIIVRIEGRDFGPVPSDAAGNAKVPIIVPPGAPKASIVSIVNGQPVEKPLDLKIPPAKRVSFVPTNPSVPADNSLTLLVRAVVLQPSGKPDTSAKVTFNSTAGTVTKAKHEGDGIYTADFTPPYGTMTSKATLQVSVKDANGAQSDAMDVALVPARGQTLSVVSEPPNLTKGTSSFQLFVKAQGNDGAGVSGKPVTVVPAGATMEGTVKDLGNGDYQGNFTTSGEGAVEVVTVVSTQPTQNALANVLVIPTEDRVSPDGVDFTPLVVLTVDSFGYPIANVPVELSLTRGDGSLPKTAKTDDNGVAIVSYSSGRTAGWVGIQAKAGGHVGAAGLVQAPKSVSVDVQPSGSRSTTALIAGWQGVVNQLSLTRGGATTPVAAPIAAMPAGGRVATVMITPDPASAGGGQTVTLAIRAADGRGNGAAGKQFEILSTAGEIGPVQDLGNGDYRATLTMPDDSDDPVKVAVVMMGGGAGMVTTIGSGAVVTDAWGVAAAPAEEAEEPAKEEEEPAKEEEKPPKKEKPKKERKPADPSDRPWLRIGAGYMGGFYSYYQEPTTQGGPLYDSTITVGFGETSSASAAGGALSGRAWLPMFEYVGFDAGYRATAWAIELSEGFDEPVSDGVNNVHARVLGRYPLDLGAHRLSFGGGIGMQANDFVYFRVESGDTPEEDTLVYDQLWVPGSTLLLEFTGEFGPSFYTTLGYEMGFTDFSGLYSDTVRLDLGYAIIDNMYVHGTVGRVHRATRVYFGGDKEYVGNLEDANVLIGLGLGFQM